MSAIAIIGMACRYASVRSPHELWENVLAQRQSFRRIPNVRLRVDDYSSEHSDEPVSVRTAAVLEDYEFDRVRFHVSKETFASTDMAHWLALDVASQALEDARLLHLGDQQRERMGVYVGNSLTGEFSRANLLRLRWPYVRRVLTAALQENGSLAGFQLEELVETFEKRYKAPFPATTEESLAGGLSNTIAGRICNYFNLKGGGYTVDGACASSLLAITTACSALEAGDVDVALAGGVDLSLDPFELAGFSKLGALAQDRMRVFDERSAGFWPGEGCGMVVLMRHEEALAHHHSPYAVIRGWGVSSDGSGGITRPEVSGQMLALQRAYKRAGYGIDSVAFFEGHGTGTAVGDPTELRALSCARREASADAEAAAIGSVKANIGHTKAAAGVAGLIKATLAAQAKILPPTTGCDSPHSELNSERPMLRVLRDAELWPETVAVRAGVSAMGFGGINSHVTLETADAARRRNFTGFEREQLSSVQDCELFLFAAPDREQLKARLQQTLECAGEISYAEMADLAAHLAAQSNLSSQSSSQPSPQTPMARASCVASSPGELETKLKKLCELCVDGAEEHIDTAQAIFLGARTGVPRIGFLFPGQGSPVYTSGGRWSRRFDFVRELYRSANLPQVQTVATETAQPCVVTASLAGLQALERCGIEASVALGHSLGELSALCWAGACDAENLARIVAERGRVMARKAAGRGAMASIRAGAQQVKARLNGDRLVIAAYNSPGQTVVSGEAQALKKFVGRLGADGIGATMLPVSHAFHSPLVEEVAHAFSEYLARENFHPLSKRVISTVTGAVLENRADLRGLLVEQIVRPVQFAPALAIAAADTDLLIEVGPGAVLSGIAGECTDKPVIALNAGGESLRGLLASVGAAFALGAKVRSSALFEGRFFRPFVAKHTFLENPCESVAEVAPVRHSAPREKTRIAEQTDAAVANSPIEVLRGLVARRTELPITTITPESRFLKDLHLNSISVSQIILEAATRLGLPAPAAPTEFANASIRDAADSLEAMRRVASTPVKGKYPAGIGAWVRVLGVELIEARRATTTSSRRNAVQQIPGEWKVLSMSDSPLRAALESGCQGMPGAGLICCVPPGCSEQNAGFLLDALQGALKRKVEQCVFVQHSAGAAALARTLYLEHREMKVTVVNVPAGHPQAAAWAIEEMKTASGFTEACYDSDGVRREPRLQILWPEESASEPELTSNDVLLVTGGGKGIAAECALELARESGCCLALIGRSEPAKDEELRQNLQRFAGFGIRFRYCAADITDAAAVAGAVERIESEFGGITALLHGAAVNVPSRIEEISTEQLRQTLGPKVTGLRNLLDSVHPEKLRLLVTFSSIIGRGGLEGEAHYALANQWLANLVEDWQREHPECRCLNLEWSVWAGAGMGQRLGVLESLMRQGITPLPIDDAIRSLKKMLAWKEAPASAIITGRFGNLPTLQLETPELPLLRFVEQVQVHYPGIELIVDSELSAGTDPYVAEHSFHGEQLFAAVCGLEAMAQVAMALEGSKRLPEFQDVRFERPIVVPQEKSEIIRIAALRQAPGKIAVAVRCASTLFQVDHFSAECIFNAEGQINQSTAIAVSEEALALDVSRDIYDDLLFHQGCFRRISRYQRLSARESVASLAAPADGHWYARHLPAEFVAGNPASRDAAIHSIQACIPHKTVLPVGVNRIVADNAWTKEAALVHAVERMRDGDNFMYDVELQDSHGRICERWEGLHLRAVVSIPRLKPWPLPLLSPYFERKLDELLAGAGVRVMLDSERDANAILRRMIGPAAELAHRLDGKPEIAGIAGAPQISISHAGTLTLVVSANSDVGCDAEPITPREESCWRELLGADGFALAREIAGKSSFDVAATAVWTLREGLRKCGASFDQRLRLEAAPDDEWLVFSSEGFRAATFHAAVNGFERDLAFGFVVRNKQ